MALLPDLGMYQPVRDARRSAVIENRCGWLVIHFDEIDSIFGHIA